jgi:hypothetical protein
MPRTKDGIVPDMIMNPHAIPSRMTIAQLLETLFGKAATQLGAIANATSFMNDGDPSEAIGSILEKEFGFEKYGNEILYDGTTGVQIPSAIFIGQCYTMRLKHMTEDKWNARAEGRREQRTHQPTGGRGNEGGLRIGEMERDAIAGHGISLFLRESMMKRGDGTSFTVCNGCGTIPIYNEKEDFYVCPLCDGPVSYAGSTVNDFELVPPTKRSLATFSKVEMPYVVKVLEQELGTYMNIGMRFITGKNVEVLRKPPMEEISDALLEQYLTKEIPETIIVQKEEETRYEAPTKVEVNPSDLANLGAASSKEPLLQQDENKVIEAQMVTEPVAETNTTIPEMNTLGAVAPPPAPTAVEPMMQQPMMQQGTVTTVTTTPVVQQQPMVQLQPFVQPQPFTQQQQQQPQQNIMIGGQQGLLAPQPQPQQISVQTAPLMMPYQMLPPPPPAVMVNSIIPGAPPTFMIDTSPQAMIQSGLEPLQNMNPSGGGQSRNRTQRANRGVRFAQEGPPQQGQGQGQAQGPAPPSANVKVTVQKLG